MTLQTSTEALPKPGAAAAMYDAFIVHAAADEWFVQGYLLAAARLPRERVLTLTALGLGELMTNEVERGVRSSRLTIVVLSSAYMDDHWAAFGEQLASYASVTKQTHGVVLPLLLEDCELPARIQALVKLDFRGPSRDAWQAAVDQLRGHLDRPVAAEPALPCPYPGMRPFTEGDAGRFFGRDVEVDRMIRWLRQGQREIYVIGPSGSGKSSLIAAGLVPRLVQGVDGLPSYRVQILRPGERPLERLISALGGDPLAAGAPGDPTTTVDALLERRAPGAKLLLAIDQLEEIFALASEDQRAGFLAAIRLLRGSRRCVLAYTLRADFYGVFMSSPLWTDLDGAISRIDLAPMRTDSLRTAIERPARELDVYFQPELVSRLLDEAAREPGALPLLQETLFQLWGKRRGRLLALADYHALGDGTRSGLAYAVKEHADDVLAALTGAHKAIAFRILLRLVNFGEGRADTRRQQPRDALRSEAEAAAAFDAVLQRLVDNRLVTVAGDDKHRDVRVDLAHEILISAWSTFAGWIETWRAYEQRRRALETAAAAWRTRGSRDGGLLDPDELADALEWRVKAGHVLGLSSDLAALVTASETAQTRVLEQQQRDREEQDRRFAESSQFYQETGWQRLVEAGRPLEALPYLVAAREAIEARGGAPSSALRMLFGEATQNLPVSPPLQHAGSVVNVAFSPDGRRVVTASYDKTARVWDAVSGAPLGPPLVHLDQVVTAAFNHDGSCVVTASSDRTARVWSVASGLAVSPALQHEDRVVSAVFSPDGSCVVTASRDHTARIWSSQSGQLLSSPLLHDSSVHSAVFSPDGRLVVTASSDRTARVWDVASGRPLASPLVHTGRVASAAFSPDGLRVVTVTADGTASVWDAVSSKPLLPPLAHRDSVVSAMFSADGTRIVTASTDHTARVWDAVSGRPVGPPLVHRDAVLSAVFTRGGSRVITSSRDHTARIWSATSGRPLSHPLAHRDAVLGAACSPDGTLVVTASADGTARVWDTGSGPVSPFPRARSDLPGAGAVNPDSAAIAGNVHAAAVADSAPRGSLPLAHDGPIASAAFSAGGTRIVTASWDRTARVWDASSGQPLSPPLQHGNEVASAVFSPDGTRVVTASRNAARIWDAVSGEAVPRQFVHRDHIVSVGFSPDGTRVVTTSRDYTARVWDAESGRSLSPLLRHRKPVWSAAFSRDGRYLITASADRTACIWDAATGAPLSRSLAHHDTVYSVAFHPGGDRVATASADGTARIWDLSARELLAVRHGGVVVSAVFSSDGTRLLTASIDRTACVWDASSGELLCPPLQHQKPVRSAVFSPDGARVLTASADRAARIWDATGELVLPPFVHQEDVLGAAFTADGSAVLTVSADRTARIWAAGLPPPPPLARGDRAVSAVRTADGARGTAGRGARARAGQAILQHRDAVVSAAFDPGAVRVVTASHDRTARVWDLSGESLSPPLVHQDAVLAAVFSFDGARIVTASRDHTARVWHAASGAPLSPPLGHDDSVVSAAFSPDGARVVTASSDHTARIWDAASGRALSLPLAHQGFVDSAVFSPDGARLVTTSWDQAARIWDVATGDLLSSVLFHAGAVTGAAFSPDGSRLATVSSDHTARIWTTLGGGPVVTLPHKGSVYGIAFSRDGTRVVTASADHTARVWDVASGEPLCPPLVHRGAVMSAALSPDGARVVTASWDHTARVWDANTGKPLSCPLQHRHNVNCAAFNTDGTLVVTASSDHTARIWTLPLASGTLQDWRATVERFSPYTLVKGALIARAPTEPPQPRLGTTGIEMEPDAHNQP